MDINIGARLDSYNEVVQDVYADISQLANAEKDIQIKARLKVFTNVGNIERDLADFVTPEMYGAGSGTVTDTEAIQAAFNSGKTVVFPNKTYTIDISTNYSNENNWYRSGLKPVSNQTIFLGNAVLQSTESQNGDYSIINIKSVQNVTIIGGKIIGDAQYSKPKHLGYGISVCRSKNILIENMEIESCQGDSIIIQSYDNHISTDTCNHITIKDCLLHDSKRQGISIVVGTNVTVDNCEIYNISGADPQAGIDIEAETHPLDPSIDFVIIKNCYIHNTSGQSIVLGSYNGQSMLGNQQNITIDTCKVDSIRATGGKHIKVCGCYAKRLSVVSGNDVWVSNTLLQDTTTNYLIELSGTEAVFDNCKFILPVITRPADIPQEQEYYGAFISCTFDAQDTSGHNIIADKLVFSNCTFSDTNTGEISAVVLGSGTASYNQIIFDRCTGNFGNKIRFNTDTSVPNAGFVFKDTNFVFGRTSHVPFISISSVSSFETIVQDSYISVTGMDQFIYSNMTPSNGGTMKLQIVGSNVRSQRTFACNTGTEANPKQKPNGYVIIGNSVLTDLTMTSFSNMTQRISNNYIDS